MKFYELPPAVNNSIANTDIRPYVRVLFELKNEDLFIPNSDILECIITSYKSVDGGIINNGYIILDNKKGLYTQETNPEFTTDLHVQIWYCFGNNENTFHRFSFNLENKTSGWITVDLTLKRKLQKNERIFFGFYGSIMAISWSDDTPLLGITYFTYITKQNYTYRNSLPNYLASSDFFSNCVSNDNNYNFCFYLEYENEVESVSYTRTVTAKYIPGTTVIRKGNFMRKATSYFRNSELVSRFRKVTCNLYSESKAYSSVSKLRFLYRLINENENFIDDVKRCLKINALIIDKKEFSDELIKNLIIGRCITAGILPTDFLERTADYKRTNKTKPEIKTITERQIQTYRSNVDSVLFSVFVIPSRIFYRTVQTIVSFWDWIRGKIRETNNIVSFFCPVDL